MSSSHVAPQSYRRIPQLYVPQDHCILFLGRHSADGTYLMLHYPGQLDIFQRDHLDIIRRSNPLDSGAIDFRPVQRLESIVAQQGTVHIAFVDNDRQARLEFCLPGNPTYATPVLTYEGKAVPIERLL